MCRTNFPIYDNTYTKTYKDICDSKPMKSRVTYESLTLMSGIKTRMTRNTVKKDADLAIIVMGLHSNLKETFLSHLVKVLKL